MTFNRRMIIHLVHHHQASSEVPNKRHRKQMNQKKGIGPDSPLFEFACDPESQMGITSEKYGIPHIRLSKEFGDLTDPESSSAS